MARGTGLEDEEDWGDSLLRAIAKTPEQGPHEDPAQLAQFRIVRRLGSGAMGVVYLARDERLGRDVAVKVLPSSLADDEQRRDRFLREARSAAAITHANIAAIYEVGNDGGRLFIVMELARAHERGSCIATSSRTTS